MANSAKSWNQFWEKYLKNDLTFWKKDIFLKNGQISVNGTYQWIDLIGNNSEKLKIP